MKFSDFEKATLCPHCDGTGNAVKHIGVGRWINGLRVRQSVTLRQVSEITMYSIGYLSDLEHDRKAWNEELFNRIKTAIEIANV